MEIKTLSYKTFTKDILLSSFSLNDRKKVWIPENIVQQQYKIDEYFFLSWIHRSQHLGYVITMQKNKLQGHILRRTPMQKNNRVCMCDWCLSVYPAQHIAQFTIKKNKHTSIGLYLCDQLDCTDRLHSTTFNNVHNMRETISKTDKMNRLIKNMDAFFEKLKIEVQ
mgnify:CR=1 FL=1